MIWLNKFIIVSVLYDWREHDFTSSIPIHAIFIFLNPLMVDLLQVEYQTKKTSPFEAHAPNMWIFFVATCVHCLGLAFEIKLKNYYSSCKLFSNFVLFSGALSSVSLASVFLPNMLGWICLGLWTILPFSLGFPFIVSLFKRIYLKVRDAMGHVYNRTFEVVKCISHRIFACPSKSCKVIPNWINWSYKVEVTCLALTLQCNFI